MTMNPNEHDIQLNGGLTQLKILTSFVRVLLQRLRVPIGLQDLECTPAIIELYIKQELGELQQGTVCYPFLLQGAFHSCFIMVFVFTCLMFCKSIHLPSSSAAQGQPVQQLPKRGELHPLQTASIIHAFRTHFTPGLMSLPKISKTIPATVSTLDSNTFHLRQNEAIYT